MFLLVTRPPGRRIQDGEISKRIVCLCLTKSHRKVGIRKALELISFHVCPLKSSPDDNKTNPDSQFLDAEKLDRPEKGKHAVSHAQPKKPTNAQNETVNIQPLDPASQSKTVKQSPVSDSSLREMLKKYDETMQGIGKLKDVEIKLDIDPTVKPVVQPTRRIPFHIRKQVEQEINSLIKQDIIEKVPDNEATPWISQIVAVPKKENTAVRLCIDMRSANTAIRRVRHPMPTIDELIHELNGSQYFSKLDLSSAYHQLSLHPDSRYITTFATHMGLYRYKRLNYGTNASAEIFQYQLQEALKGIPGVKNIADDIIIHGTDRQSHDTALENCLMRLKEENLTINRDKCKFLQDKIAFFGLIFSKAGIQPDPKKVQDLRDSPIPTNASEVRSFLGMASYSSKFIPNFADITTPLRTLTKKNHVFQWKKEHSDAFKKLKKLLTESPVMAYFDTEKETFLTVDASPVGVSAILSQSEKGSTDRKIIAYASRALSPVERRYSQTEREALSIIYGVEHFHLYLYGASFTLITDHKPLETIYGNPRSKTSARIERWVLRLQQYEFKVIYRPGATNPADYLSRHPIKEYNKNNLAEAYVNFITKNAIPKAMTIEEIQLETEKDPTLNDVKEAIKTGKWESLSLTPYKLATNELTVNHENGIILRGNRIVIPESLQKRAVALAHEGHMGLVKTKSLLREKVWFPNIDKLAKEEIDNCLPCQSIGPANPPEPLHMNKMPKGPWQTVHMDFFGPLPSGEYLLVLIDAYSRYPAVEIVQSTSASSVIPKMDKIFAMFGIPVKLKSDNGPPMNGDDFSRYMHTLGIDFKPCTPKWPKGNAQVERIMQPLGKVIRAAQVEHRNWRQEIQRFLLNYRSTPHASTKVSPAELLFNHPIKGKLPCLLKPVFSKKHREARHNDMKAKLKMKEYQDARSHAKPSPITVGDTVIVKQPKRNKLSTRFSSKPYIVIDRRGTRVVAQNEQHTVTRNVSHFKKIPKEHYDKASDSDSDDDYESNVPTRNNTKEEARRYPSRQRTEPVKYGNPMKW